MLNRISLNRIMVWNTPVFLPINRVLELFHSVFVPGSLGPQRSQCGVRRPAVREHRQTYRPQPERPLFVETKDIEGKLFYNKSNKGIKPEYFDKIFAKVKEYVKDKDLFARDAYVGSSEASRLKVRAITECAWTNLFVKICSLNPNRKN